ncbi:MAG TPA: SusD/RagB family nutrient-binding outer membrane lipoprotein, partial [Gemmatimonadaceae bacterium]|nr:SusD/RagB family nutrient-binding outer membrane lipoprotein [Gemmatimonadaceae bacterium]
YNQGIEASMAQWGVTDATAIAAFLATPGIVYTPGTAGLRQIALQKWIALYTDGVEAWSEWRRTCVPETVKPGPAAVIGTVPRRYQYSIREASVNSANMDAAVARQGADDFTTRIYWDNNPTAAPTYPGPTCGVR